MCCVADQAFYNWAIAISDRAKMRGRTKEAEELWKQVRIYNFWYFSLAKLSHLVFHVLESP